MSLRAVAAFDRNRLNKNDWGTLISITSPINGNVQNYDYLNNAQPLKTIDTRYSYYEQDIEGFDVLVDAPVVTVPYDSIDKTFLGGYPEIPSTGIPWLVAIPPQFDDTGTLQTYEVAKVRLNGELKDVQLFLKKMEQSI